MTSCSRLPRLYDLHEGDRCIFYGDNCKGTLRIVQETCTCHMGHPPCSYCTNTGFQCTDPNCGYEISHEELQTDRSIFEAKLHHYMGIAFDPYWEISGFDRAKMSSHSQYAILYSGEFEHAKQQCSIVVVPNNLYAERFRQAVRAHKFLSHGKFVVRAFRLRHYEEIYDKDFTKPNYKGDVFIVTEDLLPALQIRRDLTWTQYFEGDPIWRNI